MSETNQASRNHKSIKGSVSAGGPVGKNKVIAAYGGEGWSPRVRTHRREIGDLWTACGIDSEWRPLKAVLLHRPGREMAVSEDRINEALYTDVIDLAKAQAEHDQMVQIYRDHDVAVHYVETNQTMPPNQLFCADLAVMTPEGAILARPASTMRAGEERWVARTLGNLGIPVLKQLTGRATFEGADLMWLDPKTVVIGRGLRTNQEAIDQISNVLAEVSIKTYPFDLPYGTMHLMGMLRMAAEKLAFVWPRRAPHMLVSVMREHGYDVKPLPDTDEAAHNKAFNFVVLGPRKILMAAGNPKSRAFYESIGIECFLTPMDELKKASGAIGCMTLVLQREMVL